MRRQVQKLPDIHHISKKGQKIFEMLSEELTESHFGRFIAIEVDSGDYFIGETAIEATRRAQARASFLVCHQLRLRDTLDLIDSDHILR